MSTNQSHPNDPLHGMTLEAILRHLEQKYGFDGLADRVKVNCFNNDPSIKSCLKFFRKTPWAREKLERLYIKSVGEKMPEHLKSVAHRKTPPVMPTKNKPAATGTGENANIWGSNKG